MNARERILGVVGAMPNPLSKSVLAAILRVGRRIEEGFEGEITISVKRGGVSYIRWTQTETGDSIKEELG